MAGSALARVSVIGDPHDSDPVGIVAGPCSPHPTRAGYAVMRALTLAAVRQGLGGR